MESSRPARCFPYIDTTTLIPEIVRPCRRDSQPLHFPSRANPVAVIPGGDSVEVSRAFAAATTHDRRRVREIGGWTQEPHRPLGGTQSPTTRGLTASAT